MHIRSELVNEVQKLINLLEITSIKIEAFLEDNEGDPNLLLVINYKNKSEEDNKIIVRQPRHFRRDTYSISHTKDFSNSVSVVLGENENKFEENIFNIANILQKVINNNEIESYIKLAFNKYQTGTWDRGLRKVSFVINKSIESNYSRFYFTFDYLTFSSYKEDSVVYENSFIEKAYDEEGEVDIHHTINEATSLFDVNSHNVKKIVNSAERIRDYLFILDDINYYNVS